MRRFSLVFVCYCCLALFLWSCSKQTETLNNLPQLSTYYPLQTGKVFIYRLDSSVIPFSGTELEVRSYHAKDSIADTILDNLGRLSYRVYRFINDTLESGAWQPIATYYITPTANTVEVMDENNLRFIKLAEPLRDDYSWSGNTYIDTKSANTGYQYLDGWNYIYQSVGQPYTVLNGTFDHTATILQQDETSPPGPFDPNNYQQRNYSVEVYADGVGLIYKEFVHWTWQIDPPPAGFDSGSYGIKLNLIDFR